MMAEEILKKHLQACIYDKYAMDVSCDIIEVQKPKNDDHGDFTSNIAMKAATRMNENPASLADYLAEAMKNRWTMIQRIEIKPPGFLNFFLKEQWLDVCLDELQQGLCQTHQQLQKKMKESNDEAKEMAISSLSMEDLKKINYVHSRVHSILNLFREEGRLPRQVGDPLRDDHRTEGEKAVIQKMIMYPGIIQTLEEEKAYDEFLNYLIDLSHVFLRFSETLLLRQMSPIQLAFMLQLMDIVREIIRNGLTAFGWAAPEKM